MTVPSRAAAVARAALSSGAWTWVLPNLVLGLFVCALFWLLVLLERHEEAVRRQALAQDVHWAEQSIRKSLADHEAFVQRLARETAEGAVPREAFEREASRYVAAHREIVHVAWVDADQVVRWIAPEESPRWSTGERLSIVEQTLTFQRAQRTGAPAYGMPPTAPEERPTIEVHAPGHDERRLRGVVVAVYAADELLRRLAPPWFLEKYRVVLETDERVLGASSSVEVASDVTGIVQLDPPGHGLRLRVTAFTAESRVPMDVLVLLAGGLVVLMAWSLWALAAHTRRRRRAERERDREVAFRRAMEESVMTGLRAVDLTGRIVYVNPAFCSMVGWGEEELVGSWPPFPYWPEEDVASLREITARWMGGEAPKEGFEVRVRRRNGERFYARIYISPLIDAEGRQTGWMASLVDITERKRAEETSLLQQERLHQTSRLVAMGEMASSLAHELNQPLSAIANYCMGSVARLRSESFRREDVLGAMERATAQAERAGTIIRRMREFVNKREPNRVVMQVQDLVNEAIGLVEIDARKGGVGIRLEVPADLPPVYADPILIEQVILNLVKNGVEAMHGTAGGRELVVSARADGDRAVEVAVADRGHGVDPVTVDRLFESFYTTKPEGMGMGLSICRSIVEYHQGHLWAQPNPGGGAVFRFTLPVRGPGEARA